MGKTEKHQSPETRLPSRRADSDVRRRFFAANLSDLISKVLRMNLLDAARKLGVDYGWLRKACSVGLSSPNSRSMPQLNKVAGVFGLPIEELWTPRLLAKIWAGNLLPDARTSFIRQFDFHEFVKNSPDLQKDFREEEVRAVVGENADLNKASMEVLSDEIEKVMPAIGRCMTVIEDKELGVGVLELYGLYKVLADDLELIRQFERTWGWEDLSRASSLYERMREGILEEVRRQINRDRQGSEEEASR